MAWLAVVWGAAMIWRKAARLSPGSRHLSPIGRRRLSIVIPAIDHLRGRGPGLALRAPCRRSACQVGGVHVKRGWAGRARSRPVCAGREAAPIEPAGKLALPACRPRYEYDAAPALSTRATALCRAAAQPPRQSGRYFVFSMQQAGRMLLLLVRCYWRTSTHYWGIGNFVVVSTYRTWSFLYKTNNEHG